MSHLKVNNVTMRFSGGAESVILVQILDGVQTIITDWLK